MKVSCVAILLLSLVLLAGVAVAAPPTSSDERLSGAALLIFSGKPVEALPILQVALAAYRAESNLAGEGITLVLLGLTDLGASRTDDARKNIETGSEKLHEAGDSFTAFVALWMLAEIDKGSGKIDAAITRHELALVVLREAGAANARFTLAGFKILAPAVGIDAGALGPMLDNPEIVKPILLLMGDAIIRSSFGKVLTDAGQLDRADVELTKAAVSAQMFGGMFDSTIEANFGNLRRRQWRFDEARVHYGKAVAGIKAMPMIPQRDEWLYVQAAGQMATIEMLSGRTDEALRWNDKALVMVRTSGNQKREAVVLSDRGDLLLRSSRFDEAAAALHDSLALAENVGDVFVQAGALASLGNLHFSRGEFGSAATALERSVALYQQAAAKEPEAATWVLLAQVYLSVSDFDTARESLGRACVLAEQSDFAMAREFVPVVESMIDMMSGRGEAAPMLGRFEKWMQLPEAIDLMAPEEVFRTLREMSSTDTREALADPKRATIPMPNGHAVALLARGQSLLRQGDTVGAREAWLQGAAEIDNKDLKVSFLGAIGATYWKEGNEEEAVQYFERAVEAMGLGMEDVKVEEMLAGYAGGYRRAYFDIAIETLVRRGRVEDAFDHSERARARAFLHSMGNTRLQPARGAEPGLVSEAEALRMSIARWEREAAPEGSERANDLRQARERYQSVLKRVKISSPEYASLTSVEPLRAADLQRALPDDTTLISYYIGSRRVHAWILDSRGIEYVALAADRQQLQRAVCWATEAGGAGPQQAGTETEAATPMRSMAPGSAPCAGTETEAATPEELEALLFEPLRAKIRTSRLILVPHGVLHYVPFAALRSGKTNRYLLEDYTLAYSPSASALRFLREKESPVDGGALVIGDPATQSANRERLSGAEREAFAIARLFGTTPRVGAEAAEGLLYDLGGKYDLVHIGAHGDYDGKLPLYSRIALAKDAEHDGNLEVHEILSGVDLTGVNLVVLSACGTARGARSGGDEIVGLTRAVLYAGAPGVISTLWDIDDQAAADLMEDFYTQLHEGASPADALRTAQLTMMKRAPYADPQFWAAFQLSGDPQGRWAPPRTSETQHACAGAARLSPTSALVVCPG